MPEYKAATNTIKHGLLLREFLRSLSDKFSFIEKETNAVLDERDAQSLLLDRIQYYVDMWAKDGDSSAHSLGHINEELKEYAKHHLLGTFPPCVVQIANDEVLLRDGSRVMLRRRGTDLEFQHEGLWVLTRVPAATISADTETNQGDMP